MFEKSRKISDLALYCFYLYIGLEEILFFYYITVKRKKKKENRIKSWKIKQSGNLLISFVHSLGEGTRPTRGHTKSASISAGHRSSSGVPPSDHSLLDPQPRNAHNSLLATADPLRQRYRPPQCPSNTRTNNNPCILLLLRIYKVYFGYLLSFMFTSFSWATNFLRVTRYPKYRISFPRI